MVPPMAANPFKFTFKLFPIIPDKNKSSSASTAWEYGPTTEQAQFERLVTFKLQQDRNYIRTKELPKVRKTQKLDDPVWILRSFSCDIHDEWLAGWQVSLDTEPRWGWRFPFEEFAVRRIHCVKLTINVWLLFVWSFVFYLKSRRNNCTWTMSALFNLFSRSLQLSCSRAAARFSPLRAEMDRNRPELDWIEAGATTGTGAFSSDRYCTSVLGKYSL